MDLPFFYAENLAATQRSITLDETNSKHIVQVLRMKERDEIRLTNGMGLLATGRIANAHKKACEIEITGFTSTIRQGRRVGIGISPVKNTSRFEWFLEKVTELGVTDIYPLICHRTVREHFRHDRMKAICISAMLQSQQAWLPVLHEPISFATFMEKGQSAGAAHYHQKWMAHCDDFEKHALAKVLQPGMTDSLILIGPEGDFSPEEIMQASANEYAAVTLGETRLRTETAGVAAASVLRLV
jgi:16S rRNA (uracil1498-N3)-methyltransferase